MKKLSYRYKKKDMEVTIMGLEKRESVPPVVDEVLERYGFVCDDPPGNYVDYLEPAGDDFYDEFCSLSCITTTRISTWHTHLKNGKTKVEYEVNIGASHKSSRHKNLYTAFDRAFKIWHQEGRILMSTPFKEALEMAINKVNQDQEEEE